MEGQAFTVLPPLSPRLPPPPTTPAPSRVAPRAVAHKEASAFVILGDIKIPDGPPPQGRVSPFRGSGFRAPSPPSPSKIPVPAGKSAPASPVKGKTNANNKLAATNGKTGTGKSAPSTPKKSLSTSNLTNTKQQTLPRRRNESPSKVPNGKITNGPPTVKEPTNNKRVTTKPPVPKSPRKVGSTANNTTNIINGNGTTLKPPQPAKRMTADGKPAPAARTRLNNKPVSTEVKAGSVSKDRFSNNNSNNQPKPLARRTVGKSTEVDNAKKGNKKGDKKVNEVNNNNPNKEEEMNLKNDSSNKSSLIDVSDDDVVNKVVTVTETVPEIHKLNIEINGPSEDGPDSITVVELITPDEDAQLLTPLTPIVTSVGLKSPSPSLKSDSVKSEPNGTLPVDVKTSDETRSSASKLRNGMSVLRAVKSGAGIGDDGDAVTTVDGVVEETGETVEGPAEVEVEAGNHTVTFSSPEIHPVSPRVPPKKKGNLRDRLRDRMCGCCRGGSAKVGNDNGGSATSRKGLLPSEGGEDSRSPPHKWYSKLCKWKKEPPPPRLSKPMKAKGESFLSKLNCCKNKGKLRPRKPPPAPSGPSCWRKLFCLDRACCAKCTKKPPAASEPPAGASRMEMKRSSSVPAPPKVTGLPKLDAALVEHASVMKGAIPVLPICLAYMCLILNIVIPGTGTVISGFLCLCFGKPRFSVNDSGVARLGSLCVNLIVGISQIFTILFCLVGWGWSIWWGVIMIKVARKSRRIKQAEKAGETAPAAADPNRDVERGGGG